MAKRISKANMSVFTNDSNECKDLHKLGIPGFTRKTVKAFLEDKGAKPAIPQNEIRNSFEVYKDPTNQKLFVINGPTQKELKFKTDDKASDS